MRSLRNLQRPPTRPGAILRENILPALGMTQTDFARCLGVPRLSISEFLHEKRALSPKRPRELRSSCEPHQTVGSACSPRSTCGRLNRTPIGS